MEKTDSELIQSYLSGQRECIDILLKRHRNRTLNYISMMMSYNSISEDLLQETFVKATTYISRGKYQDNGKFDKWLLRIAKNTVLDYFRANKIKTLEIADHLVTSNGWSSSENIEKKIEDTERNELLGRMLDQLPVSLKEVVILRLYRDMSFEEIAENTGVSINTALGRMRYALINLRKMVKSKQIAI